MHRSFWKISTNTNTKDKSQKILKQVIVELGRLATEVEFEKHWDTQKYSGSFTLLFDCNTKEELMFELIKTGQLIGYHWELNGSIESQTAAYSQKSSISGVEMAEWHIDIPDNLRD
ncbi:hypothetical protein [Flagellimonas sp.]|uniref:hypothetical protein n=1 Tax=Flagellimonas sp. TaxID=2058762 RepID=UPI003B51AEF0